MFIELPDTLEKYLASNVIQMSEATKRDYLERWDSSLAQRTENKLYEKIDGLVRDFNVEYHAGQLNLSSAKKFKAVVCYGLSTLLKTDGVQLQRPSDDANHSEYLNKHYGFLADLRINKKYLQEHVHKLDSENLLLDPENFIGSVNNYLEMNAKSKKLESEIDAFNRKHGIDRSVDEDHIAPSELQAAFPKTTYHWILRQDSSTHPLLKLLQQFLEANLLLGLRPIEWTRVRFDKSFKFYGFVAVVESIDTDVNKATRTLILTGITPAQRNALINFKKAFDDRLAEDRKSKPNADLFKLAEDRIRSLQKLLKRTVESKRKQPAPTLLSTRSQVIANAKKSGKKVDEITAFFGFASDHTASRHFYKAGLGWGRFKFRSYNEANEKKELEEREFLKQW